jgi:SAM-dependent methyltransferase
MTDFETLFKQLPGGRVLDVATGRGNFVQALMEGLPAFEEITGIDNSPRAIAAASEAVKHEKVRFIQMDATCLDFPDASFDMVCISNSLHHLPDPLKVLSEMVRVLKLGGKLVVSEMYRDNQAETQLTHIELHHWWGQVDTALGIIHNETYTRQQMLDMANTLGLSRLENHDYSDTAGDPKDDALVKEIEEIIDMYKGRANGLPEEAVLHQRGESLRLRLHEVGLHWANALIIIGEK